MEGKVLTSRVDKQRERQNHLKEMIFTYLRCSFSQLGGGSVVLEVTPHQVSSSKCRHEGQLPSKDTGSHYPGQLGCVLPGQGGVGTLHTQHLQARGLGRQDCPTSNSSNLERKILLIQ